MKKYTLEKVLYFANRDERLHVSTDEAKGTDLSMIVNKSVCRGFLDLVETDGSGRFYKTTKAGERKLLKLQIDWRKAQNKDTSDHERKLSQLTA